MSSNVAPNLYLYHATLMKTGAITHAIAGSFSGQHQEILIARGKSLELLRPDINTGRLLSILSVDVFGIIRSMQPFRLTGGQKDYIVVGSDSGKISILEYLPDKNVFQKVHEETFGRTGCRRIVPGQYVAADPKGRAVMIGAVEKQKFVYQLNRDNAARLTISSPLEAHKSHNICFDIVGLDVAFEHPIFAAIEIDYQKADTDPTGEAALTTEKQLVFYELDLGLNHVVRKWSDPIDRSANRLIAVPGGKDGPGGVLVCCYDEIVYKNQGHPDVRAKIPRRADIRYDKGEGALVIAYATHKLRDLFFVLIQTDAGDLYKVTLTRDQDTVLSVNVKYFDTVAPAVALAVLKTGFLFVASEVGNHYLYQFKGIGDNEEEVTFRKSPEELAEGESPDTLFMLPRPLVNLDLIDELPSLAPIIDVKVDNLLKEETPQIYTLSGAGTRSTFRILQQGMSVTEIAKVDLPLAATNLWSIRANINDEYHRYILISFQHATIVLSIGEHVAEVKDTGVHETTQTIHAALLGDDVILQVHPDGVRRIRADGRAMEWKPPGGRKIVAACSNERQVAVAVAGGDIYYMEADTTVDIEKLSLGPNKEVVAMALQPVPPGRQRARHLAIADSDNKVRIVSVEPHDMFNGLAMQVLPDRAHSIAMVRMHANGVDNLFLAIGTASGMFLRATVDETTGQLLDTRKKFVGTRPTKVVPVVVDGQPAIFIMSSKPWLAYVRTGSVKVHSLAYPALDAASAFCSERCPEGIVSLSKNILRIFTPDRLGEQFRQTVIPLRYTPRAFVIHPVLKLVVTIESDHNSYSYEESERMRMQQYSHHLVKVKKENDDDAMAIEDEEEEEEEENTAQMSEQERMRYRLNKKMPMSQYGAPKPGSGRWASCIRLLDVATQQTLDLVELQNNEAAVSICTCTFRDHGSEVFVCVGTAKNMLLKPKRDTRGGGAIRVYRITTGANGTRLELVSERQLEDVPNALAPFHGRLMAGVGTALRLYDLGTKKFQLLRKCENRNFPNNIVTLTSMGERIIVGDVQESIFFVKYSRLDNSLYIFCDDMIPRWITSHVLVDYNTVAYGDKFGTISLSRVPMQVTQMEDDPTAAKFQLDESYLNGAAHKVESVTNFYVGEPITRVLKTTLTPGLSEVLLYSTIFGSLGVLVPFTSREDVDLFMRLEVHMRTENPPLCGRDHLSFRSYYIPVKCVIDGDLCEQFPTLPHDKQNRIASEFERNIPDVLRKIEDMRHSV